MSALAEVALLPWRQRRNQGAIWPLWAILALAAGALLSSATAPLGGPLQALARAARLLGWSGADALLSAGAAVSSAASPFAGPFPVASAVAAIIGLAAVDVLWPTLVVAVHLSHHSPAAARLVPRLRRRTALVLALEWGLLVLLHALVAGAAFGRPVQGAVVGGLWLVLVSASVGSPWLALVPAFAPLLATRPEGLALLRGLGFAEGRPATLAAGATLTLALGALVLRWKLPAGGDRHFALWRRIGRRRLGALQDAGEEGWGTGPRWGGVRLGYRGSLRRALERPATDGRLLALGLGPELHWGQSLWLLGYTAAMTLALLAVLGSGDPGFGRVLLGLLAALQPLYMTLVPLAALRSALLRRRGEEGLLRLAPRLPQGRAQNAALGRLLLSRMALAWVAGAALPAAFALLFPEPPETARLVLLSPLAMLPASALVLADLARLRPVGAVGAGLTLVGLPAAAVAAVGLDRLALPLPLPALATASLAAAALLGWRRWRRMVEAPTALPAGRLAGGNR